MECAQQERRIGIGRGIALGLALAAPSGAATLEVSD